MTIGVGVAVGVDSGVSGCWLTVMQAAASRDTATKTKMGRRFSIGRIDVSMVWHAIYASSNCIKQLELQSHSPIAPFLTIRPTQNRQPARQLLSRQSGLLLMEFSHVTYTCLRHLCIRRRPCCMHRKHSYTPGIGQELKHKVQEIECTAFHL